MALSLPFFRLAMLRVWAGAAPLLYVLDERLSSLSYHLQVLSTLLLFAKGRTLELEELKYKFESRRQTPAIVGDAFLQLFHYNA
jgi:hypothetical protein